MTSEECEVTVHRFYSKTITYWPGVVVPVQLPCMGQIDLFENHKYCIRIFDIMWLYTNKWLLYAKKKVQCKKKRKWWQWDVENINCYDYNQTFSN